MNGGMARCRWRFWLRCVLAGWLLLSSQAAMAQSDTPSYVRLPSFICISPDGKITWEAVPHARMYQIDFPAGVYEDGRTWTQWWAIFTETVGYHLRLETRPDDWIRAVYGLQLSAEFGNWYSPKSAKMNWTYGFSAGNCGGDSGTMPGDGRLNPHAGAPNAIFPTEDGLGYWMITHSGEGQLLFTMPTVAELAAAEEETGLLLSLENPENGKPIEVRWLAAQEQLEVSTFYADVPPHQFNKPYIFRIDGEGKVTIIAW